MAVVQCTSLGLFAYFAIVLTAFAISGRVWFASYMMHLTNSRNGQSPTVSFSWNCSGFKPVERGLFLPRPNTKPRRSVFSESVSRNRQSTSIPISRKQQPAYHRNSPRLLTGTRRFRFSQNWSHLLLIPTAKKSSAVTTVIMETESDSIEHMTYESAGLCSNPRLCM